MNDEAFLHTLADARHLLATRLASITREWGKRDFPADSGIGMRNFLFIYGDSFTGLLEFCLSSQSSDVFMKENRDHLYRLTPEQLVRLIGLGCFHSQLLRCVGQLATFKALVMPGIADARVKQVQAWCNWIYLAHDLPSDCASAWYAIATETHDRDKYWTNSEKVMQKYIEMLTPLGNTTAGSAPEWAGQGVHADLETRKQDPEWIAGASNKYFSDHFGGVK